MTEELATIEGDVRHTFYQHDAIEAEVRFEIPKPLVDAVGEDVIREKLEEATVSWTLEWEEEDDGN